MAGNTSIEDEGSKKADKPIVGSVVHAMRILTYLSEAPGPMRLKDIARDLKINPSSCLNILRTLALSDFVSANASTKGYAVGLAVAELARGALSKDQRLAHARPLLEAIATRFEISAMLWRRKGEEHMILLALAIGGRGWRIQADVGSVSHLLNGSMGRAMLPHVGYSESDLRKRISGLKWDVPVDLDTYAAQARLAVERGWSSDEGFYDRSMASISVPILEPDGSCESVLTAAMFMGQFDAAKSAVIAAELRDAAQSLARYSIEPNRSSQ